MKLKKIISIILAISTMFINSVVFAKEYSQKFWDVSKEHWAFEAVSEFSERGILNGYTDGSFQPDKAVTRAEWAKMMIDAAGETATDNTVFFDDMSADHWANKYVNAAYKYLPGTNGGYYLPDQAATREEVTAALVKVCGYEKSYDYYRYLLTFTDYDTVTRINQPYVNSAIKNKLISGFNDNTFRGQDSLTRAEAATLLYRAFKDGKSSVETLPDTYVVDRVYIHNKSRTIFDVAVTEDGENVYFATLAYSQQYYNVAYESKLYKMDLNGRYEEIFDLSNIVLKHGDVTLSHFIPNAGISYDKYTNSIILVGQFSSADYIDYDLEPYYIYAINNGKGVCCGSFQPGSAITSVELLGSVYGGIIVDAYKIYYLSYDCSTIVTIDDPSTDSYDFLNVIDIFDSVGEFYMLTEEGLYRCEYIENGISANCMWEGSCASGYIYDNVCVLDDGYGKMQFVDFEGKILKVIQGNNIYENQDQVLSLFSDDNSRHASIYEHKTGRDVAHIGDKHFAFSFCSRHD